MISNRNDGSTIILSYILHYVCNCGLHEIYDKVWRKNRCGIRNTRNSLCSSSVRNLSNYHSPYILFFRERIQITTSSRSSFVFQRGFSFNWLSLHWYFFGGILRIIIFSHLIFSNNFF